MKIRVGVAYIHNFEFDRLTNLEKTVDIFKKFLEDDEFNLITYSSHFQPNLEDIKINYLKEIFHRLIYVIQWKTYLQNNKIKSIFYNFIYIMKLFNENIKINFLRKKIILFKIEKLLFMKHFNAYLWSLNNSIDYLIVLESDVMLKDKTDERQKIFMLKDILKIANKNNDLFGVLAHSCEIKTLNFDELIELNKNGIIFLKKPITNGAKGYVLNNIFIRRYLYSNDFNNLGNLPIDASLNKYFIKNYTKSNLKNNSGKFFIFSEPIFPDNPKYKSGLDTYRDIF